MHLFPFIPQHRDEIIPFIFHTLPVLVAYWHPHYGGTAGHNRHGICRHHNGGLVRHRGISCRRIRKQHPGTGLHCRNGFFIRTYPHCQFPARRRQKPPYCPEAKEQSVGKQYIEFAFYGMPCPALFESAPYWVARRTASPDAAIFCGHHSEHTAADGVQCVQAIQRWHTGHPHAHVDYAHLQRAEHHSQLASHLR